MTTKVRKWGNSLAIRIPKDAAERLGLLENSSISFKEEKHSLIITRKKEAGYSLSEMLRGVTKENIPEVVDWGPDIGNEIREPWGK